MNPEVVRLAFQVKFFNIHQKHVKCYLKDHIQGLALLNSKKSYYKNLTPTVQHYYSSSVTDFHNHVISYCWGLYKFVLA